MTEQANLGLATTENLLDELDARNRGGQASNYKEFMERESETIRKLKLSFSIRPGGLGYRSVDK